MEIERLAGYFGAIGTIARSMPKILEVGDVLQTSLAEHRHDASRRAVIDNTSDLLRHPHGNVPDSSGYQLDHAAIGGRPGRRRTARFHCLPAVSRTDVYDD